MLFLQRFMASHDLGFSFVGSSRTKLPTKVKLGGRFVDLTYPQDEGYISDIINLWLDDEYGIQKITESPQTIVDIGGNIGLFSLWAWSHFPMARIYTYEPNPRVLDCLLKNLKPTNALVRAAGVSCTSGRAEIKDASDSRLAATSLSESGNIDIISLSQIVEDVGGRIDLLKLDCEGAEWEIFKDIDAFQNIESIRMEYHLNEAHSLESLKVVTKSLGYKMVRLSPNQGFGIAWFEKQ